MPSSPKQLGCALVLQPKGNGYSEDDDFEIISIDSMKMVVDSKEPKYLIVLSKRSPVLDLIFEELAQKSETLKLNAQSASP